MMLHNYLLNCLGLKQRMISDGIIFLTNYLFRDYVILNLLFIFYCNYFTIIFI